MTRRSRKASGDLFDLHLDVRKLPPGPKQKFFSEATALYRATNGKFSRRRFAMRFFGWYTTECPYPDAKSFTVEGAVSGALPVMRDWARADPSLKETSENEIKKIGTFLYHAFEGAPISQEEKIEAQLHLLQMMGAKMPFPESEPE